MVREATGLTNRCILEGSMTQMVGFKHRGMMEFYCGMHLARNRQTGWLPPERDPGSPTSITCGDRAVARFANDPNWYWAFRFAIEMPRQVWQEQPEVLCASLAPLFERPALNDPNSQIQVRRTLISL